MRRIAWMILILLVASVFHLTLSTRLVVAGSQTIKVPDEYGTIQSAIDGAGPGDTIVVSANTYYENLVVNKTVSLVAENVSTTVVDGGDVSHVVHIAANDVSLTGFTIKNSGPSFSAGIYLDGCRNVTVSGNIIMNTYFGIWFENSDGDSVSANTLSNNVDGVYMTDSAGNVLNRNTVVYNGQYGVRLESSSNLNVFSGNTIANNTGSGIYVGNSVDNLLNANLIANNTEGIMFSTARACRIYENTISNNLDGIFSFSSNSSIFYRNNFIDNTINQVFLYSSADNVWDNGAEGNYWSDHLNQDLNGDGLCDTPYEIDANNTDNYPLVEPWSERKVFGVVWEETTYKVVALSNSTIAREHSFSFTFQPYAREIHFNITGPSGQIGFFNLTVPKQLLVGKRWQIFREGSNVTADAIIGDNATHASLYLTCSFTTHTIEISNTPERDTVPPVAEAGQTQTVQTETLVAFDAGDSYDPYGTIVSYEWDFGDDNVTTVSDPNITHTYLETGTYIVTLSVKDAGGNSASDTTTVSVLGPPEALPSWIVPIVVVVGGGVALVATVFFFRRRKKG